MRHARCRAVLMLVVCGAGLRAADDVAQGGVAATAPAKSPAEAMYDKIVADDTRDALRAYQAYQAALDKARDKVLKAIAKIRADLDDVHHYPDMSVSERAKAIDALDAKEKAVKDGALNDAIIDAANSDPFSATWTPTRAIVGTWDVSYDNHHHEVIAIDGKFHVHVISSTWSPQDFDLVYADGKFTVTRASLLDCYAFDGDHNLFDHRGPTIIGTLTRK